MDTDIHMGAACDGLAQECTYIHTFIHVYTCVQLANTEEELAQARQDRAVSQQKVQVCVCVCV
jgi:hypothetical protein